VALLKRGSIADGARAMVAIPPPSVMMGVERRTPIYLILGLVGPAALIYKDPRMGRGLASIICPGVV